MWIHDLFGWVKPDKRMRVPLEDGTLPYRMKGGPYDGHTMYFTAGVSKTSTIHTRQWFGHYEQATSHTYVWKEEK